MLHEAKVTAEPTDGELVARIAARDEEALAIVMSRYAGSVLGIATRVLSDPTLAEEAGQDTFIALWTKPERFDTERGNLKTFLMGIARNKAVDMVRHEETRRRAAQRFLEEERSEGDDPFAGLDEREGLVRALRGLTERQRQALVLAYFGGLSYREVARQLEIPEGTAKTRLRDGLVALRSNVPTGLFA